MEDFVPYETVLKLEKKGYKGKTIRYHGHIYDVLKWLREEKKLFVKICYYEYGYYYEVIDIATAYVKVVSTEYNSYEQAALAGIQHTLDNLI